MAMPVRDAHAVNVLLDYLLGRRNGSGSLPGSAEAVAAARTLAGTAQRSLSAGIGEGDVPLFDHAAVMRIHAAQLIGGLNAGTLAGNPGWALQLFSCQHSAILPSGHCTVPCANYVADCPAHGPLQEGTCTRQVAAATLLNMLLLAFSDVQLSDGARDTRRQDVPMVDGRDPALIAAIRATWAGGGSPLWQIAGEVSDAGPHARAEICAVALAAGIKEYAGDLADRIGDVADADGNWPGAEVVPVVEAWLAEMGVPPGRIPHGDEGEGP